MLKGRVDGNSEAIWKAEVEALRHVAQLHDANHLVRAFAAIRRNDRLCILLEWADGGNLRDFWEQHPDPALGHETILEVIEQTLGLTASLAKLHGDSVGLLSHPFVKPHTAKMPTVRVVGVDDDDDDAGDKIRENCIYAPRRPKTGEHPSI